jgi:hypothetical protein
MLMRRVMEDTTPIRQLAPETPVPIADAVTRALARLPTHRYQTAAKFSQALESARRAA